MATRLGGVENADLIVSKDLVNKINKSPFMVIVITGGEPFLRESNNSLVELISGLQKKGIVIDTNGTIKPPSDTIDLIKRKDVLVRVSWDIPHPKEEVKLRKYPKNLYKDALECMIQKERFIKNLMKEGVSVSIQTVLHKYNFNNNNFFQFPYKLKQLGVKDWFIQRFIPSHKAKNIDLSIQEYNNRINAVSKIAKKLKINCHHKKDKRHNSVFLLVKDGDLYTQSDEKPGQKDRLGKIGRVDYFAYVSAPDHAARYIA
jgi:MoaA/NifB/PqqE/SkfB family radical SAM enzyme